MFLIFFLNLHNFNSFIFLTFCEQYISFSGKPILTHEGESVPGAATIITYGDLSKFIIENCLQKGEWSKKNVAIGTT